jgi:hypothetical protein
MTSGDPFRSGALRHGTGVGFRDGAHRIASGPEAEPLDEAETAVVLARGGPPPSVTGAPIGSLRQASIIAAICSGARLSQRLDAAVRSVSYPAAQPQARAVRSPKADNRHLAPGR